MSKHVLLYFGGSAPAGPEEGAKSMAAWNNWFGRVGDQLVDAGNQFGSSSAAGADAPASGANGYTIVSADSLDEAKALLDGHPHLASGNGARIEVFETITM
jgi:hypothetical protein